MSIVSGGSGTRTHFNNGEFDTDFRYVRSTAGANKTTILAGPSIAFGPVTAYEEVAWRFECGDYSMSADVQHGSAPADVANTPTKITL